MGNLGFTEIAVIVVLALLVFGPERLPELARNAAKMLRRFRSETSKSIEDLKRAADIEDLDGELREIGREFSSARDEVRDTLQAPARALRGESQMKPKSDGGMAEHTPPPMDPEAT